MVLVFEDLQSISTTTYKVFLTAFGLYHFGDSAQAPVPYAYTGSVLNGIVTRWYHGNASSLHGNKTSKSLTHLHR